MIYSHSYKIQVNKRTSAIINTYSNTWTMIQHSGHTNEIILLEKLKTDHISGSDFCIRIAWLYTQHNWRLLPHTLALFTDTTFLWTSDHQTITVFGCSIQLLPMYAYSSDWYNLDILNTFNTNHYTPSWSRVKINILQWLDLLTRQISMEQYSTLQKNNSKCSINIFNNSQNCSAASELPSNK